MNTKKATVVTDGEGRTLRAGAFRPGRMHDQTAVRTEGIAGLFRWREELGASRAPLRIHSLDVRDPDVEEAAGQIRIARCLECDCRLVVGRAATDVDDDPAVGERHVSRLTRADGLAAEHLSGSKAYTARTDPRGSGMLGGWRS
jgi:hypothetical protein